MSAANKWQVAFLTVVVATAAGASVGRAQDAGDASLEVTIRLLPENAVGPGELTRRIELPPAAAPPRPADDTPPADPANGTPGADGGLGLGRDVAAEARERGRAFGQEVAEQAREQRENAGRPDDPGPPADVPGRGNPPVTPPGPP